jgi:hypothetical protein
VLVELANETVAAAQQSVVCFRFLRGIREGGTADVVSWREAAMRMRRLNRRSVNNETEQQKREHAGEGAVLFD